MFSSSLKRPPSSNEGGNEKRAKIRKLEPAEESSQCFSSRFPLLFSFCFGFSFLFGKNSKVKEKEMRDILFRFLCFVDPFLFPEVALNANDRKLKNWLHEKCDSMSDGAVERFPFIRALLIHQEK